MSTMSERAKWRNGINYGGSFPIGNAGDSIKTAIAREGWRLVESNPEFTWAKSRCNRLLCVKMDGRSVVAVGLDRTFSANPFRP